MKPKVVYWNNIPTPYMIERFNALIDRGNLDFQAWFTDYNEADRSWKLNTDEWRFPFRLTPCFEVGKIRIHLPPSITTLSQLNLLVAFYSQPVMIVGLILAKLCRVKTALWCQVTPEGWFKRRLWKEQIKKVIISQVDGIFGSGEESRKYALFYGAHPDRARKGIRMPRALSDRLLCG